MSQAFRAVGELKVDLSDLAWADVSLMIDLAMVACRVRRSGGTMIICGAQPQIGRLIELVGLHHLPSVSIVEPAPA